MIWSPAEQLPRAELRELQRERLLATFGVELSTLSELPFTGKADLHDAYPFGLLRVPVASLARVHASSGTHGKPTVVGYTSADLDAWTELMARCMTLAGVRPGMLVHNANTYGLFTGGHGFHQGAERIGAPVVPVSGGMTTRQAVLLHDLGAQVLVSTPSYAIVIAHAVEEAAIDPATLKLELGLFGGEPWTDGLRAQIESALPGLRAVNFYGLLGDVRPGCRGGVHRGARRPARARGPLRRRGGRPRLGRGLERTKRASSSSRRSLKEAMPFLRYRTGDIGSLTFEACHCGRTTARIRGLRGRRDDMIIVRGVNVYPSNVEQALLSVPEAAAHYQLVVERSGAMDELTVQCEPAAAEVDPASLRTHVERVLREHLGIRVRAEVLDRGAVPRSEGKAVRVVDRR